MINKIQPSKNITFGTVQMQENANPKKEDKRLLSNIDKYIKNSADMNDTINVPRTIFKGYLGVMAGTSLITLGSFVKNPKNAFGIILKAAGTLISLYGTFAFVRPFLMKDKKQTEQKQEPVKVAQEAPQAQDKVYKLVEVEQAKK